MEKLIDKYFDRLSLLERINDLSNNNIVFSVDKYLFTNSEIIKEGLINNTFIIVKDTKELMTKLFPVMGKYKINIISPNINDSNPKGTKVWRFRIASPISRNVDEKIY